MQSYKKPPKANAFGGFFVSAACDCTGERTGNCPPAGPVGFALPTIHGKLMRFHNGAQLFYIEIGVVNGKFPVVQGWKYRQITVFQCFMEHSRREQDASVFPFPDKQMRFRHTLSKRLLHGIHRTFL